MERKEHVWLLRNWETVSQYAGEYIAIVGESIVAHGKDFKKVLSEAERNGATPLIHKVPPSDKELVV